MKAKHKRAVKIFVYLLLIATGVAMLLFSLKDNMVFFYTPSELYQQKSKLISAKGSKAIRVGGMVKRGSINNSGQGVISFVISDFENEVTVSYKGMLPDLFKEGSGAVAQGVMDFDVGVFNAKKILAKHDENYMPPSIKNLKQHRDFQ